MPRSSPFHIALTRDEQNELETRVRKYTSPYCDVIRAKIVPAAPCASSTSISGRAHGPI